MCLSNPTLWAEAAELARHLRKPGGIPHSGVVSFIMDHRRTLAGAAKGDRPAEHRAFRVHHDTNYGFLPMVAV